MGTFGEGFKAFNWVTDRIDSMAKFFKKKGRENEVEKINNAIDTGNSAAIGDVVRKIVKDRNKRTDA